MKTMKRFCLRVLSGRTASCAFFSLDDKAPLGDLGKASLVCSLARETGGLGIEDDVMVPSWMVVEECGGAVMRGKAVMKSKVVPLWWSIRFSFPNAGDYLLRHLLR